MDVPGFFILLGAGWALGVLLLTLHTARTLLRPPRRTTAYAIARQLPSTPAEVRVTHAGAERSLEFAEWTVPVGSGVELPVWDVRGLKPTGPMIILTHGWGDSRVVMLQRVAVLARHARRVVVWDLPGHGDSPVSSNRQFTLGLREHLALCALLRLVNESEPAVPIILHGFSLGAGISLAAAVNREDQNRGDLSASPVIVGVIAEAPYCVPITPARNVLRQIRVPYRLNLPLALLGIGARLGQRASWLQSSGANGFDRRDLAAQLSMPLLVLHGSQDAICPAADARDIADAHQKTAGRVTRRVEIIGGGHTDLWTAPDAASATEKAVVEFIESVTLRSE